MSFSIISLQEEAFKQLSAKTGELVIVRTTGLFDPLSQYMRPGVNAEGASIVELVDKQRFEESIRLRIIDVGDGVSLPLAGCFIVSGEVSGEPVTYIVGDRVFETRIAADNFLTFARRPGHLVRDTLPVNESVSSDFCWLEYLFRFDQDRRKLFEAIGKHHVLYSVFELSAEALSDSQFPLPVGPSTPTDFAAVQTPTPQEPKGNNHPNLTAAEANALKAETLAKRLSEEEGNPIGDATDKEVYDWLNDHHSDERVKPVLPTSFGAYQQARVRGRKKQGTRKNPPPAATGKSVVRQTDLESSRTVD